MTGTDSNKTHGKKSEQCRRAIKKSLKKFNIEGDTLKHSGTNSDSFSK